MTVRGNDVQELEFATDSASSRSAPSLPWPERRGVDLDDTALLAKLGQAARTIIKELVALDMPQDRYQVCVEIFSSADSTMW